MKEKIQRTKTRQAQTKKAIQEIKKEIQKEREQQTKTTQTQIKKA